MKQTRQLAIRTLLDQAPIASQDELRRKLAARGFHVTQATLSRDIAELRLTKSRTGYTATALAEDDAPITRETIRTFGLEARQALNLVVLITTTGGAQPIAAGIDYEEWPEVVGTIAGDDTVLIICPDAPQATLLRARIESCLA